MRFLTFDIILEMDTETSMPNLVESGFIRAGIAKDIRFAPVLDSLVSKEKEGVSSHFTPMGAELFNAPEQQVRLDNYAAYARSFNEYLDDLMGGNRKPDDQYLFREGESNGIRTKLGKSGVEGQVFNFPPYVVKETRSDYLEKVSSNKYIPHTQIESLMVMQGLRPIISEQTGGAVSVPEHYGVISFELKSSKVFSKKPQLELMIMEKVGDAKGTTAEDVEKGIAYQERKTELAEKIKQALEQLRQVAVSLPHGSLRDLGAHNLIVNPEAFDDNSKPLFFLIDQ